MRLRPIIVAVAVLLALVAPALVDSTPAGASLPPDVHQGNLVPENPRTDFEQILDGRVLAADRVGDRIVVGGDFTQIRLADGTVITQPYLAAFDIDTGALDQSFLPTVDKKVLAIEAADVPGTFFVGGKFNTIDGVTRRKLAKIDLGTGTVDPGWVAQADGPVKTMDFEGGRLFVGGDFTDINGSSRSRLAELDPTSGAVDPNFTIGVTGERDSGTRADGFFWGGGGIIVRSVRVTPDGSKLVVMHRGDLVGGLTRWGAAVIDISTTTPSVTDWQTDLWPATDFVGIVEGELSPDGSYFVVSNYIGNYPLIHDVVIAFPVAGGAGVQPLWVTQMFDSVYGVSISDAAVYVGGHFCWTEGPNTPVSPTYVPNPTGGNQYSCQRQGGGVWPDTVFRDQLAALDPATGLDLGWITSSNSFNGVRFLRVIDRGLIVGHDGDRINGFQVGRMGFMDLGPGFDPGPSCTSSLDANGNVVINWDDDGANHFSIRRDGSWLATVDPPTLTYTDTTATTGSHSYILRSIFSGGVKVDTDCGTVAVGAPPCGLTLVGSDVVVTWTDDGANHFSIRRDGSWLATVDPPTLTYTDTTATTGSHSYILRSIFSGGVKVDTDCGTVNVP